MSNFYDTTIISMVQYGAIALLAIILLSALIRNSVKSTLCSVKDNNADNQKLNATLKEVVKELKDIKNVLALAHDVELAEPLTESVADDTNHTLEQIQPDSKLYVGNIDYSVTEDDLAKLFSKYGKVEQINIPTNRHSGKARGFGFVTFSSIDDAQDALSLDGSDFQGRKIQVSFARAK